MLLGFLHSRYSVPVVSPLRFNNPHLGLQLHVQLYAWDLVRGAKGGIRFLGVEARQTGTLDHLTRYCYSYCNVYK